ncbi:MAG: hypothetical protein EOM03_15285 [Clostridia bacterium]|nr:hypothetical protein [Clostridia bacterium]
MNHFLDPEEFCSIHKIDRRNLRRWAKEGTFIEQIQLGPRTFRYRLRAVGVEGERVGAVSSTDAS